MSTNPRAGDRLVIGGPPRAELLPPEFAAEARLRAQRRGMVGIAILAVVIVGLAYGYVTLRSTVSAQLLASANAETTSLISQQQDYAQVGIVNGQLATIGVAEIVGTSTEIDWKGYLALVQASLPAGTVIDTVNASTAYPGTGATTSTSPLGFTSIAEIAFSAGTSALPNVSSWIENLSKLPGYAGNSAGSITSEDDGTYRVTMILYINEDALSDRLLDDEGEVVDPAPAPTESPTPTPTPTPTATSAREVVTR